MQLKKPQLQRQQVILTKLGFYRHKCDGIWGPESIAAKKKWEQDGSFIPALPNNGLPFGDRDPLPKGMQHDRQTRMFVLAGLSDEEIVSFMPSSAPAVQEPVESIPVPSEQKQEPKSEVGNVEEVATIVRASEEPAKELQDAEEQRPNFGNKKKHKHHR